MFIQKLFQPTLLLIVIYIYIIHINFRNMGLQIISTQNPLSFYNIMIFNLIKIYISVSHNIDRDLLNYDIKSTHINV